MIAAIPSAVLIGVDGHRVSVEVHVSNGLPGFTVVGLPDAAVRESRDRVRAACFRAGSLAAAPGHRQLGAIGDAEERRRPRPADRHRGAGGIRGAEPDLVASTAFVGSSASMDRSVGSRARWSWPSPSVDSGWWWPTRAPEKLISPADGGVGRRRRSVTGRSPVRSEGMEVGSAQSPEGEPVGSSRGPHSGPHGQHRPTDAPGSPPIDLSDVRGQRWARRALEVAAAGGHHLLMVGPPGSGKTMLATRLPGLLPALDRSTALETTRVHSVAGLPLPPTGLVSRPPFRCAPSRDIAGGDDRWWNRIDAARARSACVTAASCSSMSWGSSPPWSSMPCASRSRRGRSGSADPADRRLPRPVHPGGFDESLPLWRWGRSGTCRCSDSARERYARRLSGPLLDRFDIAIWVDRPQIDELISGQPGETTAAVAARVATARRRAADRGVAVNAGLLGSSLDDVAPMTPTAATVLERQVRSGLLSARGLHRVRRLARTVADLDGSGHLVEDCHVHEALLLRSRRGLLLGNEDQ